MPKPKLKPFPILTIGLAATTPEALCAITKELNAVILDVRGRPVDRRRGYGKLQIERALYDPCTNEGRYVWVGDRLGGVNHGGSRENWKRYLPPLLQVFSRFVFMCACGGPGLCHRHELAMLALTPGRRAFHLLGNELIDARDVDRIMNNEMEEYESDLWDSPAELADIIERYRRS